MRGVVLMEPFMYGLSRWAKSLRLSLFHPPSWISSRLAAGKELGSIAKRADAEKKGPK